MKKKTKKTKPQKKKKTITKSVSKKALYKKCIQAVIQMAEDYADFGDCSDELLDEIGNLKKQLDKREQTVIGFMASGTTSRVIEIDEASPGSELAFKV